MKKINVILFIILILSTIGMVLFFIYGKQNQPNIKYPFFRSTKYTTTNVRSGPGEDFPIIGIFKEKYIPFKVVAAYKNWYQIQDVTGKVGWVFKNITSQVKTAFTTEKIEVYRLPELGAKRVATIDPGIIVMICKEQNNYVQVCLHISNKKIKGWVLKSKLWGIE